MSRQNKVNPGMYTQRGRLTPDDAARQLQKMRRVGSQHTWQPTKKDALPRRESKDPAAGTETTEDNRSASKSTKAKSADAGKSKATGKAKTAAGKKKTAKASKAPAKRTVSAPKRKAVLARNVGGGGATPRPAAKRRKS